MNDNENRKAPEELADEALDAIAGGACGPSFANSGAVKCCGEILRAPADSIVTCPVCGKVWKVGPGLI